MEGGKQSFLVVCSFLMVCLPSNKAGRFIRLLPVETFSPISFTSESFNIGEIAPILGGKGVLKILNGFIC